MGDVCTGSPTLTSFSTSTSQSVIVTQSTSESVSVAEGTVVTRTITSGSTTIESVSTAPGSTTTVQVEVPVTITTEQVVEVPVTTLFAPCTSSETTSSSSTSRTTPTSSSTSTTDQPETTSTSETRASRTSADPTSPTSTGANNTNTQNGGTTAPTPTPTPQSSSSQTATGTLVTTTSVGTTTLPNGAQSTFTTLFTTSIAPNGTLNDSNNSSAGKSGTNTRAVAIGVGVTGGVIALIILIFGITWHMRRKRRNSFDGLEDSDIWGPGYEAKPTPLAATPTPQRGYTYNPYGDSPMAPRYAPVPTGSPPRSRPLSLADPMAGGYPPAPQPGGLAVTAPLLTRAKTADEILYEAARQDLPKSRTSSATASHHTRASETGLVHRTNASLSASHMTHGSMSGSHRTHASVASESMKSRRSESVGGMLNDPGARGSMAQDAHAAQRYQDLMDAPTDIDRPMSPVSVVAPRLAIVNPDT